MLLIAAARLGDLRRAGFATHHVIALVKLRRKIVIVDGVLHHGEQCRLVLGLTTFCLTTLDLTG